MSRMRKVQARAQELSSPSTDPSETTGLLASSQADGNNESWEEISMQEFAGRSSGSDEGNTSEGDPYDLRVNLPPEVVHMDGHECSHQGGQCNLGQGDSCSSHSNGVNIIEPQQNEIQQTGEPCSVSSPSHCAINQTVISADSFTQNCASGDIHYSDSSDVDDIIFNRHPAMHTDDDEHVHLIPSKST